MQKNFNEVFFNLKKQYEQKERNHREIQTYEFLKKMIKIYGYNSVCEKISLNKQSSKNNELGIFIDDIKNSLSLELLCSQMFYLDDSISYIPNADNSELSDDKKKINTKENNTRFKSEKNVLKIKKDRLMKEK